MKLLKLKYRSNQFDTSHALEIQNWSFAIWWGIRAFWIKWIQAKIFTIYFLAKAAILQWYQVNYIEYFIYVMFILCQQYISGELSWDMFAYIFKLYKVAKKQFQSIALQLKTAILYHFVAVIYYVALWLFATESSIDILFIPNIENFENWEFSLVNELTSLKLFLYLCSM